VRALHRDRSLSETPPAKPQLDPKTQQGRSGKHRILDLAALWRIHAHRLRPSVGEWVLFGYLAVACALTGLQRAGDVDLHSLASTPDNVAAGNLLPIFLSALVVAGPMTVQVVETAVFGILAMRLAGARVFWTAAVVAHVLGTIVVYVAVWITDRVATPTNLSTQLDYGISLMWCAALGVIAGIAWWGRRPLPRLVRLPLAIAPALFMVYVTLISSGLAHYEHGVAFALAAAVVLVTRRWPRSWHVRPRSQVSAHGPR